MRIASILVDRANYGRLAPVLRAIKAEPSLELQIICGGSMVINEFGQGGVRPVDIVRADGFTIDFELQYEFAGANHMAMSLACAASQSQTSVALKHLSPDLVILIGDRHEALGAASAAHFLRFPIVHFQGGEVSGCLDNGNRNAITMLSSWHVPATQIAAERVAYMAELLGHTGTVLAVGCPSSDLAAAIVPDDDGDGNPTGPLLCQMHPTTDAELDEYSQMTAVLNALKSVPHSADVWWPNIDAGSGQIHKAIRTFKRKPKDWMNTITNLPPEQYLTKLANTRCAVGNSSSFVRDSSFFGTPVVLVGNRQRGRECGENVIHVPCEAAAITEAIKFQLEHGRYDPSELYGSGDVSAKVVAALVALENGVSEECIQAS